MLLSETKPPISLDQFCAIVEQGLGEVDSARVLGFRFVEGAPAGELTGLGDAFWKMEKNLRNELVRLRSSAAGTDPRASLRDEEEDPFVTEAAAAAFKAESPLEAEQILDNWRWKMIDQLQSGHFFDEDFFAAYYLKLQLLIRKDQFDVERGKENFQAVYQQVLKNNQDQTGVSQ